MNIGIPKETSIEERRVGLTPVGVFALVQEGHVVHVEKDAGKTCGFTDQEFQQVGAQIVFSGEEVFRRSQLIVKVQPPTEEECRYLEAGKVIFSLLGIGITRASVLRTLLQKKVAAIGYEFIEQPDGNLPVLTAMSEIAGNLLPQIAGRLLESEYGGRGITLAGVSGVTPATVVILGAGVVGFNAARAFSALGAQVLVMDKNLDKLRAADRLLDKRVATTVITPLLVERWARLADVLIGAVLIPGRRPPSLVTEEMVKKMKPGSVIIDVSIDQGGCVATSRPTTLSSPTFVQHGVIHYCVPNIPASVARTASHALNNAVLPWVLEVANDGLEAALRSLSPLRRGIYLYNGHSTQLGVSEMTKSDYTDMEVLLTTQG
ncbi:MAG: alanine dehydrogenase [candidate division KSB1 bacterium]|nr:alanine dehydrogenase [candidate division KSB1 bacterium]MDZ7273659.1 alanine dehydrogenase [candidate division KSB1 bacterium]MDZ7285815.1 alanine dehydrogenase [candidate division KSB1 bacterium]MDZ7298847.1 alanine dehydrogenase [candidate division KSB1 bacterium]MDZ7308568.1 alanine dehydrogenase [candidate division KSB1 bacterium]